MRLSSHPLPPSSFRADALRRIYESTPPTPPVDSDAPSSLPSSRAERSGLATLSSLVSDLELRPVPLLTPRPPDVRPLLGSRFALDRELDSGGTAVIWLARDMALGEPRAVKLLTEHAATSTILRSCFLCGARAAMGVRHPNVVRVYAVHEPEDRPPYAVMELLQGEPLHAVLAREGRLVPELVLSLARGAARGLAAAHEFGIVHCDVKPENLFVVGHERNVKVLDFDLSWMPDAPEHGERHVLRGTAKYMAPEQIVGDQVDARTDVYSLGVVLFRMLTGHLPFDLELGATLLRHQVSSPIPPPSWLVDDLDPRLDALVVRATRKNPKNRYPDMAALLADLDALLLDRELASSPVVVDDDRYPPQSDHARDAIRALEAAA
jgi:eukaryotic-like serine/threonine-protein kinase